VIDGQSRARLHCLRLGDLDKSNRPRPAILDSEGSEGGQAQA